MERNRRSRDGIERVQLAEDFLPVDVRQRKMEMWRLQRITCE